MDKIINGEELDIIEELKTFLVIAVIVIIIIVLVFPFDKAADILSIISRFIIVISSMVTIWAFASKRKEKKKTKVDNKQEEFDNIPLISEEDKNEIYTGKCEFPDLYKGNPEYEKCNNEAEKRICEYPQQGEQIVYKNWIDKKNKIYARGDGKQFIDRNMHLIEDIYQPRFDMDDFDYNEKAAIGWWDLDDNMDKEMYSKITNPDYL